MFWLYCSYFSNYFFCLFVRRRVQKQKTPVNAGRWSVRRSRSSYGRCYDFLRYQHLAARGTVFGCFWGWWRWTGTRFNCSRDWKRPQRDREKVRYFNLYSSFLMRVFLSSLKVFLSEVVFPFFWIFLCCVSVTCSLCLIGKSRRVTTSKKVKCLTDVWHKFLSFKLSRVFSFYWFFCENIA